ncbi:MAG: hypothetical protein P4K93_10815 [Terracidiphilus sp.]|nr:hypothetical protein [Terracidiphilus sp.]MDR3798638.1 hypothetical protein [Terracidiphilus sp.]
MMQAPHADGDGLDPSFSNEINRDRGKFFCDSVSANGTAALRDFGVDFSGAGKVLAEAELRGSGLLNVVEQVNKPKPQQRNHLGYF